MFCLTNETLFEVASQLEAEDQDELSIAGLAGERVLRVRCLPELDWVSHYYMTVAEGSYVA